jgi:hypothetical protein
MDTIDLLRGREPKLFAEQVALIRAAGTDNLSHFGNGYQREGGYSLQQNPDEFAALVVHLLQCVGDTWLFLEIGSASGGTARLLHEQLWFPRMLSIDDGTHHRYPEFATNVDGLPLDHFKGDSHSFEARAWLDEALGSDSVDVAFIDGDHSEAGVWTDVEMVRPHMRSGGRYIFHDTVACEGVRSAWQRGAREGLWTPLAEYVGKERPLGIGVGYAL